MVQSILLWRRNRDWFHGVRAKKCQRLRWTCVLEGGKGQRSLDRVAHGSKRAQHVCIFMGICMRRTGNTCGKET